MRAYFSHDEGARNDPKLVDVLMTLGHEGKSVYWDLVEMLYEQGGYLMLAQCKGYAFALRTNCDLIQKLVNDFGLFTNDGERFWSETALRRLEQRNAKSAKAKESAAKRWEKSERNANALPTQCEGNAIKGKESKVKERMVGEGQPASQPDLASPAESPQPQRKTKGGAGAPLWPDEAKVFTIARFAEYTASIGFGNINRARYLPQIQQRAEDKKEQRTEGGWELFVREYLNTEVRYNRLMEADPPGGYTTYQNPNGPAPTPKTTGYSIEAKLQEQRTKVYI